MLTPSEFIEAARVPVTLKPQTFGPWEIRRTEIKQLLKLPFSERLKAQLRIGFDSYTLLERQSWNTLHLARPEVVMEDTLQELQRHLPIWLNAKGSVLVTGLGLGCVVRGLLASAAVERITVVEIDASILRIVGHEFKSNPRVELIHGDALKVPLRDRKFDFAWHDLWTDGEEHLVILHVKLIHRFKKRCRAQGAWQLPRMIKRIVRRHVALLG